MAAVLEGIRAYGGAYDGFPDGPEAFRQEGADAALRRLFQAAVAHAQDRINWYDKKAGQKGWVARGLRWWALLLFAVGTLAPIFLTLLVKLAEAFGTSTPPDTLALIARLPLAEIGFVSLGIAGALVIFDQFFDTSGSWIRFRQAQARLEVLLADLRFAWAGLLMGSGGALTDKSAAAAAVKLLRDFVVKVEQLAETETKEWAERFRARMDAFDRNPNLKVPLDVSGREEQPARSLPPAEGEGERTPAGDAASTGAAPITRLIPVEIEDVASLDAGSLRLTIDGVEKHVPENGVVRLPLKNGVTYHLVATAMRGGQTVCDELSVAPAVGDESKTFKLTLHTA